MNKRVHKKRLKKQGLYVNPKETLDLDCNIAKYVLPRLKLFKKLNNGYPGIEGMETEEKWDEALDKMIWSFEQAANYYEIYESIDCNNSDWKEKYKETNDKIQEGLLLFAKWFQHLGW
uniref:Uncharacterized protein n=1 Tax=Siphoviridae sp. ctqPo10 TaxID=2827948 RepID=A0A8S5SVH9_9CAUD|nr:MAG TPA: hypothetical protein [Siphoviridae sp. ctqPo10]